MAKRTFDKSLMSRNKSLKDIADGVENLHEETKEVIEKVIKEPTKENIANSIEVVEKDKNIPEESRNELISHLKNLLVQLFSFDNCPDSYEQLKDEAIFLSKVGKYSFILMAQRLKKIRDNELYKQDGYNTFEEFMLTELSISRRTVYNYIDIVTIFEKKVQPVALDTNIEYSKLIPIMPLLKSKNDTIPKEEIRDRFLSEIETKSKRELEKDARDLKIKYGLIKEKEEKDDLGSRVTWFINKLPKDFTENDLKQIDRLIEHLENIKRH